MRFTVLFSFFFWCCSFCVQKLCAQEIDATVLAHTELLSIDEQNKLSSFQSDLEYYINNSRYTDQEWEGAKIPIILNIYFTGGGNGRYTAQLHITAYRYLGGELEHRSVLFQYVERNWTFEYYPNTIFTYQPNRFDPLSSLLDFYMLLIIGLDADSYQELGGTPSYQQAYRIWELGFAEQYPGFSRDSEFGEYSKFLLVSELLSAEFADFRKLLFQYYAYGLDLLLEDRATAQRQIDAILSDMVRFKHRLGRPSTILRVFFDTKYQELIEIFRQYPGRNEVQRKLQYLDPGHSLEYQQLSE